MTNHIFTSIEATVGESKWTDLSAKYEAVTKDDLPAAVLSSHLVQDTSNPETWRIVTIWESLDAMKAYRASVETPIWLQIFQEVGASPVLTINEIKLSK